MLKDLDTLTMVMAQPTQQDDTVRVVLTSSTNTSNSYSWIPPPP